jgi:ubiquinone/menaquinone biosynthesis C-methylase UbiE
MSDVWSERAELYRTSASHASGADLDTLVEWAEGETALDVATGGGHVARRLRERGLQVVTADPAPGMGADTTAPAEHLPFADSSFDTVATRIAPHHFDDVPQAMRELARVARQVVLVEDTLYTDERVEEAEKLRDPTHVRNYTEDEWRQFFEQAGLEVEEVAVFRKEHELESWLSRTGCQGAEAKRVRELLAHVSEGDSWFDTKILLRGRP